MDNINLVSGAAQLYTMPPVITVATDPTSDPAPQATITPVSVSISSTVDSQLAEQSAQQEAVFQAAISFKNTYAVSDHSFTIFKDANGTYITRYVSLRDGTVTYIPEPTLIRHTFPVTSSSGSTGKILLNV